ncbi:hypothetical protein IGI04_040437 [Brassica rapa subsp. trilocularis]|uniref:START domain-containing protein n=1 Tax=Brassica rapa subsp. trilocularis TaxID=1813537 RepID=A0ABQ7KP98_BRACM|nr:hypothetical protein IGI04_040437 [Brassica rapa subsp. trilocularis]
MMKAPEAFCLQRDFMKLMMQQRRIWDHKILKKDKTVRGILWLEADLGVNTQSRILTLSLLRDLQEGFVRKLFGDERYELLVKSQELLRRGEIELDRFQGFKK